ncbi:MAG: uracil-DNA glycosylase family protein [Gemmatimonadota bacterium]
MTDSPAARYADIFRRAHAHHPGCVRDPWLMEPCRLGDGTDARRSLVWSRRNGPWTRHDTLWIGAAPGNAGGMGSGAMGAHATRIPFGGDIAGANLDVLLSSVGLDRNRTFIVAALNQLPERGGGEPRVAELREPVGAIPSSLHLLRETILAAAPRLAVALGNVGLRATVAATRLRAKARLTLPGLKRLEEAGLERHRARAWPADFPPDEAFQRDWAAVRGPEPPHLLWLLHPSAQNMSPYAGQDTAFHHRMVETLAALRGGVREVLGRELPDRRPGFPDSGIYALPEWRDAVGPRHAELDALWRAKGV